MTTFEERERMRNLPRQLLTHHQLGRLNRLLARLREENAYYREKFAGVTLPLASLDELASLPLTTKDELLPRSPEDGNLARNRTFPLERYVRCHQTSGTRGRPLVVLDTPEDWRHWIDTWQYVLDVAEIGPADRVMMAFSFGPFIGFWSAFDAVSARGAMAIPGGGLSTAARLEMIRTMKATAVFCTPSYALRMAEVAAETGFDLAACDVRVLVVAGEPGGSVPAIRAKIESAWSARLIDHSGASEVGPWGCGNAEGTGLHVIESEFIAEFLPVDRCEPPTNAADPTTGDGVLAELVLTSLGREGSPVVRYRTGDLVRPQFSDHGFVFLPGGVLGRVDDMMIVRGVNVFPTSIEHILRGFPEVLEYRMTVRKVGAMDTLEIEVEDTAGQPERIANALRVQLGLSVNVSLVEIGSLPRYEAKAARFVDLRKTANT